MIRYSKLSMPVRAECLIPDLGFLREEEWNAHLNRAQYTGDWKILSLIAPGGRNTGLADSIQGEVFMPTPLLERCSGIRALLESFQCPLRAVRLMNLRPGAVLSTHRDVELSFEHGEARLHIPLQTNPGVRFVLDGERLEMEVGTCWYINANLPHSVINEGESERIHLVIDCEVNHWLRELFASSPLLSRRKESVDRAFQLSVIESLIIQGTAVSMRLARELQDELDVDAKAESDRRLSG